jgi:BirA family transcriptional regulator, biotin operon repressor / biotin---[acetyl-CoA-carboxylase] ligase
MYKEKVLNLLRASRTSFLSGEELARKIGISRTMVWKHIKSLEREGFEIEAVPSQGYRIVREPDLLRKWDLLHRLQTRIFGKEIHLFPQVESTNSLAVEMASKGLPEGAVVIAETQTNGKGRLNRKWYSPKGNLYLSMVLRPEIPLYRAPLLTLMGAVAVASTIRAVCGIDAAIKWPNDIYVRGRKVGGLLTEMSAEQDRIRHIVLGIGIDVNMELDALPVEIRGVTTTLAAETGGTIDRTVLLQRLFSELERWYRVFLNNSSEVLSEWTRLSMTIGNRVLVSSSSETIEGQAEGIDSDGRLIVRLDDGSVKQITAGDVTLRPRQNSNSNPPM